MKFRTSLFAFGLCLLAGITTHGQKIKYKDLFILLNAKQYDQAEPFLKKYLVENMDNANAVLFMGYILEEKALADDVLIDLKRINQHTDSAVLYLDLAYKGIDEKELRKNDEYYQMYSRRDLRTGKFGLKLSDVQFDIEKRIKYLKDRQQRVILLHEKFNTTQRIYGRCETLFKGVASRYKDQLELFLRSDDALKSDLKELAKRYDSCFIVFNDYKTHMASLGKTGHNQELDVQEIGSFKHDGYTKPDFIQDEIKIWDFKRWALSRLEIIENDIAPIRESLVKIDGELNGLREKLRKDSVSVSQELKAYIARVQEHSLKKYDPKPMPLDVFALKIQELNYGSNLAATRNLRDTSSLALKRDLSKRDVVLLSRIDSVSTILNTRNLDYDFDNYKDFVRDAYGSASVLKSLIKTTGDFAIAEKAMKENQVKSLEVAMNWILDKRDSIPVSAEVKSKSFIPVSIVPERYTFGLSVRDTTKSYFYSITPSRKMGIRAVHAVDTAVFKKGAESSIKGISASPDSETFFVVLYSETKKQDKIPAIAYQVATHGLVWFSQLMLDGTPGEIAFNDETRTISLKITNDAGSKMVSIDKNGKLMPEN